MNLDALPDEPLERLAAYRKGMEEERERVLEALKKEPQERNYEDWLYINMSPYGKGQGCGC